MGNLHPFFDLPFPAKTFILIVLNTPQETTLGGTPVSLAARNPLIRALGG
jgi:hypothetical protein